MKKILKTAAVALAGMLAFGVAACTDGTGLPIDEVPSYYKDWEAAVDTSVTAVWNFATNYANLSTDSNNVLASDDEIKPSSGTGATLFPTYVKGGYEDGKGNFKTQAGTATLDNLSGAYYFTLTLEKASNIQIYAVGAGGSQPRRLVAVVSEDGKVCGKMNLDNNDAKDKPAVKIKGAPAGKYNLYVNSARLIKIDVNASNAVTEEKPVVGIALSFKNAKGENLPDFSSEEAFKTKTNEEGKVLKTRVLVKSEFPVVDASISGSDDPFGASAEWSVIDVNGTDVAKIIETEEGKRLLPTASGQAIVRARVGRYVADFAIVVEGDVTLTTEAAETMTLKALTETLQLNALNGTTNINEYVDWESSDPKVATVTNGKVVALKAGKTTITASYTLGRGEPQKETFDVITVNENNSNVITLLDTKDKEAKKKFPAQNTWGAYSELDTVFKDVLKSTGANASCTIGNFMPGKGWAVKSVTSNVDDTQYPGILFAQTGSNADISKDTPLVTFDITITPEEGKTVTLTDMTASFRANKYKIRKVEIKKGDSVWASASKPATSISADKDWRDTRLILKTPQEIDAKTALTVTLNYEEYKGNGDQFSVSDIKLFFEK
ncbi:MAG: Ig-like domain-containing protein [Treponemataceae bacterium]|nr:Ig-like domain-containing protein [Treponemataceae bacterium]